MDGAQLLSLFRPHISSDKKLSLDAVPELQALCAHLGPQALCMENTTPVPSGDELKINGDMKLFNNSSASPITLVVQSQNGALRLTLRGDFPASWSISKGFGPFPGSFRRGTEACTVGYSDSLLSEVAISEQSFIITNYEDEGQHIATGINIYGNLALADGANPLKRLLGMEGNLPLRGSVVLKDQQPAVIDLRADISGVSLKFAHLKFEAQCIRLRTHHPGPSGLDESSIELVGRVTTDGSNPIIFTVVAAMSELDDSWTFSYQAGDEDKGIAVGDGMAALSTLAGSPLRFDFPDSVKSIFNNLYLRSFGISLNPFAPARINHFWFGVSLSGNWEVIPGVCEIINPTLGVVVFLPTDPNFRLISPNVRGTFALGKTKPVLLDVEAEYADEFSLTTELREGSVIDLADAISSFTTLTHLPETLVEELFLEVSTSGYLLFECTLETDWSIPLGINRSSIDIQKVSLRLERDDGNFKGSFSGVLSFGKTELYVRGAKSAPPGGWQFEGSTGSGQQIPVGELVRDLADKFGNITLPAAIADLIIENLWVSFDSETKDFNFTCAVKDDGLSLVITIDLTNHGSGHRTTFGLVIGELYFNLSYDSNTDVKNSAAKVCVATYSHSGQQRNINIKNLIEYVSTDVAELIPESLEIDLKDLLFAFSKSNKQSKFLFGLDIGASISLSNLPLVGREFPPDRTVSVDDLRLLVASKALTQGDADAFNSLIPTTMAELSARSPDDNPAPSGGDGASSLDAAARVAIPKGLTVSAKMNFGGSTRVLSMPVSAGAEAPTVPAQPTQTPAVTPPTVASPSSSDGAKWFNLQKTFGPVYFDKVGVQYQDATLWFLLNAALSSSGLTLSLDGLSVGSPLNSFSPRFNLHGLGIDYQGGGVEIGAAFLRIEKKGQPDQYDGTAVIKTKALTISALGSYTKLDGHPSLFIYAFVDYPLGGPAFFYVTGLAVGFGYNRKLIAPSIENVADFPLIKQAVGGQAAPGGLSGTLQALQQYIPPAVGEIFLAVGVKFNSFKLIDSFALLTVEFGSRFVVNILGLSTAIIPTPEAGKSVTPLAEVQIAWKATFDPADGFLGVDARLTSNSYILSKDCHLTGGYASHYWFSGEHAGDFVQTLGGYHPSFDVPKHYPVVPRLGFNWKVSGELTIKGDAYYALTGSALMAGGHLEVTFESGDLKAWLKLGADFLISWKPYHYDARVYVDVGVSYTFDIDLLFTHIRFTLTIDVGADLHLWGPDFTGTAEIHLWIISFSISFGADASQTPQPIDWDTFQKSFLPKAENVCSITVKDGLEKTIKDGDVEKRWIINPRHFSLVLNSAIPLKSAKNNQEELALADANTDFGIGSMAVAPEDLDSRITVNITRDGELADHLFAYAPVLKRIPAGLWGKSLTPDINANTFIEDVPTGFEITPRNQRVAGKTYTMDLGKFKYSSSYFPHGEHYPQEKNDFAYSWESAASFVPSSGLVSEGLATNTQRESLLKALNVGVGVSMRETVASDFLREPGIGDFSG